MKILYDGNNNPISRDEVEDLWKYLSTDHRAVCCTQLDAKFYREKGKWKIAYDHKVQVDSSGNKILVPQKTEGLESALDEDCFVNIDFNRQGLPKSQSAHQEYNQGENIYYRSTKERAVARFYTSSVMAVLDCRGDPGYSNSGLGVFACAKNAGGKQ